MPRGVVKVKVASILPVANLHRTINNTYHMALAQFIGASAEYTQFFKDRVDDGHFVILDNGAAEGQQPTIEELIPKYEILRPSEIVLPDTIYNKEETLSKGEWALFKLSDWVEEASGDPSIKIMAVPHGETFEEWLECLEEILDWPIDTIGISKFITPKYGLEARRKATLHTITACMDKGVHKEIHLLGCWDHPKEIGEIVRLFAREPQYKGFLRGTDSAVPYVYTAMGETLVSNSTRPEYHMDFLSTAKLSDELEDLLSTNINAWEAYCNGKLR